MACQNCIVSELQFEVKFLGKSNLSMIDLLEEHFNRADLTLKRQDHVIRIQESGARELLHFSRDFLDIENILFSFQDKEWAPLIEMEAILEMEWIDDVIDRNAIICYSQPIVDANKEIFGYEILSRFTRADDTLIYPNEIFSAAKARGRLYALDRLCRMAAVKYSVQLKNKKAFINFIPTSIYSPEHCLTSTVNLTKALKIDASRLVFEVVESEQVSDISHLRNILNYYHKKGFQYALDDVGEGYSTMEALSDLKPHFMKLDMKYVQGVSSNIEKQHAAKLFLSKALEVKAVPLAEGVETVEDFEWLKTSGYQLFQGYLFGKPSPEPQEAVFV